MMESEKYQNTYISSKYHTVKGMVPRIIMKMPFWADFHVI